MKTAEYHKEELKAIKFLAKYRRIQDKYLNNNKMENPKKEGSYICRMNNAYVKMCYWNGKEWLDMWKPTLEGSVTNWVKIPKNL